MKTHQARTFHKKAQSSVELMLILFFALAIISMAMVVVGNLSLDIHKKNVQAQADDFAKMITNEFNYLQDAQNGYKRELEITPILEEEFNVTITSTHLTLKPTVYTGNDSTQEQYYFFPTGVSLETTRKYDPNFGKDALVLIFTKNVPQDLSTTLTLNS